MFWEGGYVCCRGAVHVTRLEVLLVIVLIIVLVIVVSWLVEIVPWLVKLVLSLVILLSVIPWAVIPRAVIVELVLSRRLVTHWAIDGPVLSENLVVIALWRVTPVVVRVSLEVAVLAVGCKPVIIPVLVSLLLKGEFCLFLLNIFCGCCGGCWVSLLGFDYIDNAPIFFAISAIMSLSSLLFLSSSLALIVFANSFLIRSNPDNCPSASKYGEFSRVLAMSRAVWGFGGLCINI